MSIDKSYLELALENIHDGQSKDDIVSLINEALKQASTDTEDVVVNTDGNVTIPQSKNSMVKFMSSVEKLLVFNSTKQGKVLAKEYLKEMLNFAASQNVDDLVIEELNEFLTMFD